MKNIFVYYLAITLPVGLLILLAKTGNTSLFAILILTYAIPYRIIVDGMRLVEKNQMKWSEVWKLFIPWMRYDYFRELYFKK